MSFKLNYSIPIVKTLGFVAVLLCFSSCSKDGDDSNNPSTSEIIGSYVLENMGNEDCDDGADVDFVLNLDLSDDGCDTVNGVTFCTSGTLMLNADQTFVSDITMETSILGILWDMDGTGTYEITNQGVVFCSGDNDCGTFEMNGNRLSQEAIDPDTGCKTSIVLRKI